MQYQVFIYYNKSAILIIIQYFFSSYFFLIILFLKKKKKKKQEKEKKKEWCKTIFDFQYLSSYYNLSNVCLFVCSPTPPRSLGRSSPNLEGRWRAAPDISLRGSFFERSRSSRPKVKFVFFFLFVPLLLPGPWADLHQTWWEG